MRKKSTLDQERARLLPESSRLYWNGRGGAWNEFAAFSCALTIAEYEPAYKAGREDAIFDFIAIWGERALKTEWVQGEIAEWREQFSRRGSESAKRKLLKVGRALVAKGQGRVKHVSTETAQKRARQRNTQTVRDQRALRYCDLGLQAFRKIADDLNLPARSEWRLRRIAEEVASKVFSRGSQAMRQAKQWYGKGVGKEISLLLEPRKN